MTNYNEMTVEHLGTDATEHDLAEFQEICREAQRLNPEMDDDEITDAVWGEGDYFRNARQLGVNVDAIELADDE